MIFTTIVILISLLTLSPTFSLGLFGDDWLAFFRYAEHLGPQSPGTWNHLTYFLTPYGAQDITMGILRTLFGFEGTWYYFISYLLRLIAAFSFYPLVFYLTKNKIASFYAVAFFSVTTIGFDTTNWVFNMPSYITVALFNLFLYFFLKSREVKNVLVLAAAAAAYYLVYVTTPIRMHGSLLFILLLEAFWVAQNMKFKIFKKAAARFALVLVVFLIIRYTGQSQGPPQEAGERFNLGIQTMSSLLSQGQFEFLFNPIIMFGSMIIPDLILPLSLQSRNIFLLLLGGFSILSVIFLLIKFFKDKNISTGLFIGICWSILSFFFAWWWVPTSIFPTTYRYFIVSAMGVTILLATLTGLAKEKRYQIPLLIFLGFLLIIHIYSTRLYINTLLNSHSQQISQKIWSSIPHVPEIGKSKEPIIFYFEGDGTNGAILHDVITFGFPPHMAILYNLREEDGGFPIPMTVWQDVVSAVSSGKTLPAYGYPEKAISLDRIYAFHLTGKDNLFNITDLARKKLLFPLSDN